MSPLPLINTDLLPLLVSAHSALLRTRRPWAASVMLQECFSP
jgi:hypothetical protein